MLENRNEFGYMHLVKAEEFLPGQFVHVDALDRLVKPAAAKDYLEK